MDASRVFQNQKSRRREKRDKFVNEERDNEKLSKLIVSKFGGTSLNWFRF